MNRRSLLGVVGGALAATSGCLSAPTGPVPAHTVTVYLAEREATRDVTVTVTNEGGDELFERTYELSDANEAEEDDTFPADTEPETVTVVVDGTRFERDWPNMHGQDAGCGESNWAGIEVWVEGQPDEEPTVRLDSNCQHVTMTE